jgi:hypothetical protein
MRSLINHLNSLENREKNREYRVPAVLKFDLYQEKSERQIELTRIFF